VLETRPNGRLLRYDLKTGQCTTVLYDLYLANGLSLSRDQDFLLIAEMSVARIRRCVSMKAADVVGKMLLDATQ